MAFTTGDQSAVIVALRDRVAELQRELARSQEIISRLTPSNTSACDRRQRLATPPAPTGRPSRTADENPISFPTLALHSPTGIFQCDLAANGLFVNHRFATIAGVGQQESAGQGWLRTLHPEDRQRVLDELRGALEKRDQFASEFRFRHDDGTTRWVWGNAVPLAGENGDATTYLGNILDHTPRRQAENALRDSEQRFRSLSNSSPVGIFLSDETGNVVYANSRLQAIYGYDEEQLLGIGFARVFLPEEREEALGNWLRLASSTGTHDVDRKTINGSGELRWVHVRSSPMISPDGRLVRRVGTVEDITDRKRAEKMIFESEKLAATGRIAARIAHEINNPLAGIKNSFLLVKDAIRADHPYFSYVARIENEIDRIARIVRQMFELHRPDLNASSRSRMVLGDTIRDVVALVSTIAPASKVTFEVETDDSCRAVWLPEDSLRQVLYNIIVNAIEASPEGGIVKIGASLDDGMLEILVSDRGEGIPDELRTRIYEPFYTTKSLSGTGGLGLGLSISRGIVEAMQGTLDFQCAAGAGTVFRVKVPIRRQETQADV